MSVLKASFLKLKVMTKSSEIPSKMIRYECLLDLKCKLS